jgi:hypothetical protein
LREELQTGFWYQKDVKTTGKLQGKVAVITGGTSGMALATAKLIVDEGGYVLITGRRQEQLDQAVKAIGKKVTACEVTLRSSSTLTSCLKWLRKERPDQHSLRERRRWRAWADWQYQRRAI